jgi:hypothetical protein
MPLTLAGWCDDGDPLIDTNFMVSRDRERDRGGDRDRDRHLQWHHAVNTGWLVR